MAMTRAEFDQRLKEKGIGDAERARLAGEFYREVVRPRLKTMGREERAPVISEWTARATAPAPDAGFKAGLKRGFRSNLTGSAIAAYNGEAPVEHDVGFVDAATDLYQNFGNRMGGPGRWAGIKEAAGETIGSLADPAGLAIDLVTAKTGGKLATALATKLAPVSARAARRAASLAVPGAAVTSGAIQGSATAALQGGTTEDARRAVALGAVLSGTMAARGRRATAPAPAPKPAARPTPRLALPPAPAEAARLAEYRAAGMTPAEIIAEQRSRAVAKRPPSDPPEAILARGVAEPTDAPLALPERSQVNVPPGGFKPDAMEAQVGRRPDAPAAPRPEFEVRQRIDATQQRVADLERAIKKARKPGTVSKLNVALEEARRDLSQQVKSFLEGPTPAPVSTTVDTIPAAPPPLPRPVARPDAQAVAPAAPAAPDPLAGLLAERERVAGVLEKVVTQRGRDAATRQLAAIDHQVRAAGGTPPAAAAPEPPPSLRPEPESPAPPPARQPESADDFFDSLRRMFAESDAQTAARRRELGLDEGPPARPTDAPGAGGVGGVLRRLASEEGGEFTMPGAAEGARVREAVGRGVDGALDAADAVAQGARRGERAIVEQPLEAIADALHLPQLGQRFIDAKEAAKRAAGETPVLRNFVSDAGVPAGYADLKDEIANQTGRDLRGLEKLADDLDGKLDEAGQAAAYEAATTPGMTSPEAERVRAATTPISRELHDLGALTKGQHAEWEGNYLPRSYDTKPETPVGEIAAMAARAARTLRGSMHRGTKKPLTAQQLALYSRPWEEVGPDVGGRVRIRDTATGTEASVPRRRVGDFVGTWKELGRKRDGSVTAWRDWTPAERERMGEVKHVGVALRKMAAQTRRDLNNGRLLNAIAKNPEWAVKAAPGAAPPEGWVHLSNQLTKNGVPRWGKLADHHVHPAIARDLESAMVMDAWLRDLQNVTGMRIWKKAKTVYNVGSHVNNFMVNVPTLELAGGSVADLPAAARVLKDKGADFQRMNDLGLFDDGVAATEFAERMVAAPIDWRNPLDVLVKGAGALDAAAVGAYQAGDDVFRAAFVLGRVRDGVPIEEAVKQARQSFYVGGRINSRFARIGSATIFPFIKPWLYAVDKMPELIARNPAKAAKLFLYYQGAQLAFKTASGDTDEQLEGRQAMLPDYQQGPGKMQWIPAHDSLGQRLALDVQNWNPFNFLDTTERTAIPEYEIPGVTAATGIKAGLPSALVPNGPMALPFWVGANIDPFYQKPLRTSTGNNTLEYLARELGPATVSHAGKLAAALLGRPDYTGRRYDVPTAAANLLGFKLQPFNEDEAYSKLASRFGAEAAEIDRAASSADKDLERGIITVAEHEAEMARLSALYQQLNETATRRLATAEKALPRRAAAP